jgi:DNA-binding protein HU-beta
MSKTVTKTEIASAIAQDTGLTKADASAAFEALVGTIERGIRDTKGNGAKYRVSGLGTFEVKHRPARTGRNPRTGQPMKIAASSSLKFKPAKNLKDAAAS